MALGGIKEQIERVRVTSSASPITVGGLDMSDDRVRAIVREILAVYDADKTDMMDYALETSG